MIPAGAALKRLIAEKKKNKVPKMTNELPLPLHLPKKK